MRLVACVLVQDSDFWIVPCLKSLLGFIDRIIVLDGGSKDDTIRNIQDLNDERITIYSARYEHNHKGANGKQRNKYLEILKKEEMNSWCLVIDADEVISDNGYELKEYLKNSSFEMFAVHMEHFIWNLGLVDATVQKHFVQNRLFKVTENLFYDEVEHPVLKGFKGEAAATDKITLFHYGYINGVRDVIKKFNNHKLKSNVHTPEFLVQWKDWHIKGTYPIKKFEGEHPRIIKEVFEL